MKFQTLPVRRRPAPKGIFHRLSAVTRNRRQRVSASATMSGMEMDANGAKISRALFIIFIIHIVAIALIFIHQRFLDGRPKENLRNVTRSIIPPSIANKPVATPATATMAPTQTSETHITKDGENYQSIASTYGVSESDLRQVNQDIAIRKGSILKIPAKKTEVADSSADHAAIANTAIPAPVAIQADPVDDGMVDAVPVGAAVAPKAKMVPEAEMAKLNASEQSKVSGKTHLVKKGDTVVKIAKQYKVTQDELMRANSITDPTKLKAGANLVIP